jgi:hypothetical protein
MGPAVGNVHFHRFAILLVGDFYFCAKGQGFMGGGQLAFAVRFAISHLSALEFVAVKGGFPGFGKLFRARAGGNGNGR